MSDSGSDVPQGSVPSTGWSKYPWYGRELDSDTEPWREDAAAQVWGCRECLGPLPGTGGDGGITCERHALVEALSQQVKELWEEGSRLCSIEEDEQEMDRVLTETL